MKKVIICSAHYWKSPIQISAHQFARKFVKNDWKVAFLCNPISILHILKFNKTLIKKCLSNWAQNGIYEENEKLFYYCPFTLMPITSLFAQFSFVLNNWHHLSIPKLSNILKKNDFNEVDLLIIDSPLHGHLLDSILAKKTIFRITDYNPGFDSASKALAVKEAEIIKRVDHVVITAKHLYDYAEKMGAKNIIHISNGVDFEHFNKESLAEPPEYASIPGPRAIYVGSLAEWFDYDLLIDVAKLLPHISFIIIGPKTKYLNKLENTTNIYLLGPRSYEQIPQYLQHSDVGIIPFNVKKYPSLVNNINPIKLYEYFAAGLSVVSTEWDEIKNLNSPAFLCNDKFKFASSLEQLLKPIERIKKLENNFILESDWNVKFDQLIKQL